MLLQPAAPAAAAVMVATVVPVATSYPMACGQALGGPACPAEQQQQQQQLLLLVLLRQAMQRNSSSSNSSGMAWGPFPGLQAIQWVMPTACDVSDQAYLLQLLGSCCSKQVLPLLLTAPPVAAAAMAPLICSCVAAVYCQCSTKSSVLPAHPW
jgi:hypothetical protein